MERWRRWGENNVESGDKAYLLYQKVCFGGVVRNLVRSAQKPAWRAWTLPNRFMGRNKSSKEINDRMELMFYLDFLVWIGRLSWHSHDCSELPPQPWSTFWEANRAVHKSMSWWSMPELGLQKTGGQSEHTMGLGFREQALPCRRHHGELRPIIFDSPSLLSGWHESSRFWWCHGSGFQHSHLAALGSTPSLGPRQEIKVATIWFPK